jgi:hypothetical protein
MARLETEMSGTGSPSRLSTPDVRVSKQKSKRRWMHLPHSPGRRLLFLGIYLLFCWGIFLAGGRLYWWLRAGVPPDETAAVWDYFYPEVRRSHVKQIHPRHDDERFDVLLLGGSVLEPAWGPVESLLASHLRDRLGERYRLFNLARAAHTSRDSLLKYSQLSDEQFELVIVYDGINDVRLNCCPRARFRNDYRHFPWYDSLQKRLDAGRMLLPASLVSDAALAGETISTSQVDEASLEEGRDIKTDRTLRQNLDEIVSSAAKRGDLVVLTTFAYFVPANYTRARFEGQSLEYEFRPRSCAAEMWGKPRHVVAALEAQNAAIRSLSADHPEVLFVDEQHLLPATGRMFIDPCHLTDEGCRQFVDNLWPVIERRIAEWQALH